MANVIARMGGRRSLWRPTRRWRRSCMPSSASSFRDNAVEYFVSYYDYYQPEAYVPQRDLFIEKDSARSTSTSSRCACRPPNRCWSGATAVIVATVSAHLRYRRSGRLPPDDSAPARGRQAWRSARCIAAPDRRCSTRATMSTFQRGTFRVRGDVIDIFPAEHSETARCASTLFDDEIESLQLFDPLTGHIRQQDAALYRLSRRSHYVTPREHRAARGRNHQDRAARAARRSSARKTSWWRRSASSSAPASTWKCCSEIGFCKGIENYSRHLSGATPGEPPPTLIDYLPKDALMFIDEAM